ncbi:MAG TPA: hypothetical protein VJ999_11415 [Candidatus Sulfotelmatobacter sp.]|nr:hypothetical protein [Candidatus Sulfotelmatobacter sp.]
MAKSPKKRRKRAPKDSLRSLDIRKQKYVAGRLSGKSKKASAIEAGYSESMAENAAAKIESKDVRRAFQQLTRKAVPAAKIVKRLREGLDATWVHQDGKRGEVEEPYYRERREYLILAAKLGGYYIEKRDIEAELKIDDKERSAQRQRILDLLDRVTTAKVEERMRAQVTAAPKPES